MFLSSRLEQAVKFFKDYDFGNDQHPIAQIVYSDYRKNQIVATDMLGEQVNVGDIITFSMAGNSTSYIRIGKILEHSAKGRCKVAWFDYCDGEDIHESRPSRSTVSIVNSRVIVIAR